jgi:OmpA-OmpF porin, OOP family
VGIARTVALVDHVELPATSSVLEADLPAMNGIRAFVSLRGVLVLLLLGAVAAVAVVGGAVAQTTDLGSQVPTADAVNEGLFPDEKCKELEAAGFKCMGFKPPVRYSLPASAFKVGSAELPGLLKQQLDVFAEVLRTKHGTDQQVRIIGHADASGTPVANQALSVKRAEAVRDYLAAKGTDPAMLVVEGVGAAEPKNASNPMADENRRVEIGRKATP